MVSRTCSLWLLCLAASSGPAAAAAWPADGSSTELATALRASIVDFEPSGIVWHAGRGAFIVVGDGGDIAEVEDDGTLVADWSPGYNLESVAIADPAGSIVYVGSENDSVILAFDLDTGAYTGDEWDISAYVYSVGLAGFEALTWVPDGAHAYGSTTSGGVFYAGWQYDADIYVFEPDLATSGAITYLDQISTTAGYTDLSGLDYNAATGTLFAVYDAPDRLEELEVTSGVPIATYTIPVAGAWEGVAMHDGCPSAAVGSVTFADDAGGIDSFGNFPFTCLVVDLDGDGAYSDTDCDDADALAQVVSTWWEDGDGDGYGDAAAAVDDCGAPADHVGNADDCDDGNPAIHPGAGEACDTADTDEDCDGLAEDASASGQLYWYIDGDGDGHGAAAVLACDQPAGAAANAGDCDDTRADVHPGGVEVCDGATDEDCDALVDDADPDVTDRASWYVDADDDGYGSDITVEACAAPGGTVSDSSDCDDASAAVYPGADEIVGDGVDQDCDGADLDGDADTDTDADTDADADSDADTDTDADSDSDTDADVDTGDTGGAPKGDDCGCAAGGGAPLGWALLLGMLVRRRR